MARVHVVNITSITTKLGNGCRYVVKGHLMESIKLKDDVDGDGGRAGSSPKLVFDLMDARRFMLGDSGSSTYTRSGIGSYRY